MGESRRRGGKLDAMTASSARSLGDLFFLQAERHRSRAFLHFKNGSGWRRWTWEAAARAVGNVAGNLAALDLRVGDRVALLSENRPEWFLADLACLAAGLVDVPIYPTNPAGEVEALLARSGSKAIFLSSPEQWRKIEPLLPRLPQLRHVFRFDDAGDFGAKPPLPFSALGAVRASGDDAATGPIPSAVAQRLGALTRDHLATILFTSGTTGEPKGVMLTHGNLLSNCEAVLAHVDVGPGDKTLSFLPLSHSFERTAGHYALLLAGGEIAYATSHEKVAAEIREVRPTLVLGVPRFYEKVQARILGALERAPKYRRALFDFALRVADEVGEWRAAQKNGAALPVRLRFRHELSERLVFSLLRRRLGGRLRFFVSGGAPLDPEIVRFFGKVGLSILEGYGLTETAPVVACNRQGRVRPGSVGEVLPGVAVSIAEDGEILVRGPNVMRGYLDDPVSTAKVLDPDGTFRTGDVGRLEDGFLYVTDRKKDLIIGSGGKNVAPAMIEGLLKRHRAIGDVCLVGDRRPYLIALIVPDESALKTMVAELGLSWSNRDEMLAHERVRGIFEQALARANDELAPPERVRRAALLREPFSQQNQELTPTLKVRRRVVEERYRSLIDGLYAPDGGPSDRIAIQLA
jgi:long-chain acyl-CoA synthetase